MLVSIQLPAPYKEAALPIELMEVKFGIAVEDRTLITSFGGLLQLQLSAVWKMVGLERIELSTSRLSVVRSGPD